MEQIHLECILTSFIHVLRLVSSREHRMKWKNQMVQLQRVNANVGKRGWLYRAVGPHRNRVELVNVVLVSLTFLEVSNLNVQVLLHYNCTRPHSLNNRDTTMSDYRRVWPEFYGPTAALLLSKVHIFASVAI